MKLKLVLVGIVVAIAVVIAAHKIDTMSLKIDAIDKKLDTLVNTATRPSACEIDTRR